MSYDEGIPLFRVRGWPALVLLVLLAVLLLWLGGKRFSEESLASARALVVKRIPMELARARLPDLKAAVDGRGELAQAAKPVLEAVETAPEDIAVDTFTARGSLVDETTVFKVVFRVKDAAQRTMYFQMDYRSMGWLESSLQQTTKLHYWLNLW